MKFLHISDLHIGKRVNEFSMLYDQCCILEQIISIAEKAEIEAVLIAGDIYDKPVPSAEAVELFDWFITQLNSRGWKVFCISGNHDSPERIAFGSGILSGGGVYMSPLYNGTLSKVTINGDTPPINIYLMPYLRPSAARKHFPDCEINTYTDAVKVVVDSLNLNTAEINILVAHQFVTGAVMSESEELSVGGLDNVDSYVFDSFDYVALGHIHRAQKIGRETVRYCGTPLKYSFSEAQNKKSVTIVSVNGKNNIEIDEVELNPIRDMRELKGSYMELTSLDNYKNTNTDDYLHIILTDSEDVQDAVSRLRIIYPNIMKLSYGNRAVLQECDISEVGTENKTPKEIFTELYEMQYGCEMTEEQIKLLDKTIKSVWEEQQ